MDNDALRRTYDELDGLGCPFEKSILTNEGQCSRAARFLIAEREGVHCTDENAQAQCLRLLAELRQRARFALRTPAAATRLAHAQSMRMQVGGLRGLQAALAPGQPVPDTIGDIHGVIGAAVAQFGGITRLPYQMIVRHIAACTSRRRARRRRDPR